MTSHLRICSLIGSALLGLCCSTRATIYPVNDLDVAGLKNAITASNTNGQDDTIELATNGTYVLTATDNALNGLPAIAPDGGHKLTIHGNGATIMRSSAAGTPAFRILYVNSGSNVTLDRLILSNGSPGTFHGGAIYNDGETANVSLTITNCTLSGNTGDYGGAIFNDGYQDPSFPAHIANLTVTGSLITGNTGTQYGGGIWNESGGINMNVSYCTFSQNRATARSAGAIQFDGSTGAARGSITNCTFTGNSAANYGGAVNIDGFSGSAILPITNCTFDNNTANRGGGVAMDGSSGNAVVNVTNCTFNRDFSFTLGDAIYLSQTGGGTTSLSIGNTILASADPDFNLSVDNFSGGTANIASQGHNLSDDAAGGDATTGPGGFLNQSGDIRNTDPLLDPAGLQNNGGPTLTIALQSGSPAVNQGGDAIAPERDQRGYLRQVPTDIGAFELNGLLAPIAAGSNKASFSVNFPLTGKVGLEPRTGGPSGNHQLAMSFASPVTLTGVTVQSGVGTVSNFTASGSDLTVNLTGVANAQHLVVRLANVNDGVHTNNADIPMDFLLGDTNADHFVDAIDSAQTKSKSGQAIDATNFREDVNNDGFIDAIDVALVKSKSGTALPTANSNPGKGARRLLPGKSRDPER
jgi:hypothetical protein